jgi:hypothetical protein
MVAAHLVRMAVACNSAPAATLRRFGRRSARAANALINALRQTAKPADVMKKSKNSPLAGTHHSEQLEQWKPDCHLALVLVADNEG